MICIVTKWWCVEGKHAEALTALRGLVTEVWNKEPDTLMYCLHTAEPKGSLPPPNPNEIIFLGAWTDHRAFDEHRKGKVFTEWLNKHLHLFVCNDDKLYVSAEFANRFAGFVRNKAA